MRDITGFHLTPLTLICDESKVHYGLKYWSKRAEKSQIYTLRILEALFVVYEKLFKVKTDGGHHKLSFDTLYKSQMYTIRTLEDFCCLHLALLGPFWTFLDQYGTLESSQINIKGVK